MLLTHCLKMIKKIKNATHNSTVCQGVLIFLYGFHQRLWSLLGTFQTSPEGSTKCQMRAYWYLLTWGSAAQNVEAVVGKCLTHLFSIPD